MRRCVAAAIQMRVSWRDRDQEQRGSGEGGGGGSFIFSFVSWVYPSRHDELLLMSYFLHRESGEAFFFF